MGFNAAEIGGMVVITVAGIMQISSVATLKWQTSEVTAHGFKVSADYGLFRVCINNGLSETCLSATKAKGQEG